MIKEQQIIEIVALQFMVGHPELTMLEAIQEVNRNLFMDNRAAEALRAIGGAIWKVGYMDGRPLPLTVSQKCNIAQEAFRKDGSYNVMQIIEQTQLLLLEQYDEKR